MRITLPGNLKPLGYVKVTGLSSAKSLPGIPRGARLALLQAGSQGVRFRDDGSAPTGTDGMLVSADASPFPYQGDLQQVQVIETAASAVLHVLYYGTPESQQ